MHHRSWWLHGSFSEEERRVRLVWLHRHSVYTVLFVLLALAVALFGMPFPASSPGAMTTPVPTVEPTHTPEPAPTSAPEPEATPPPEPTPVATLEPAPVLIPLPTLPPEPPTSANAPRVGIQAGHWITELPAELAHLETSIGAVADGYNEAMINLDVARRTAALLQSVGVTVDVLPAAIPPGYNADAFVALHADGAAVNARGFKVATPWAASAASEQLRAALEESYAQATGMPRHAGITAAMRGYYAFNYRRYEHSIARTTPAVIVELGFLTDSRDRAILTQETDRVALGLANGIITYLNNYDPHDLAARTPPDFGVWRAADASLTVRSAASDTAAPLLTVDAERPLIAFEERDGWLRVIVAGAWDQVGWVRRDSVEPLAEAVP
jgi:hypothetical protein